MEPILISVIASIGSIIASIIGTFLFRAQTKNSKALEQIHVLVNSRLTEALNKINRLESYFGSLPGDSKGEPDKK